MRVRFLCVLAFVIAVAKKTEPPVRHGRLHDGYVS